MLKATIYKLLKLFDIKISRYGASLPLDLSRKKIHPKTISNLAEQKKVIINLSFEDGRTNRFFSLTPKSFDPHVFSIVYSIKKDPKHKVLSKLIFEMIESYKKKIILNNLSDFFGLKSNENQKLNSYPVWSAVLPWEDTSIEDKLINFPKSVKVDRAKNGFVIKSDDPGKIMKEDMKNSLPSHINQYVSLLKSIKKNGYIPEVNNNYIEVELLLKGDDFCWKPSGEGNHRATVVASLGYKTIKAIVTRVVRFEDLDYWPNVINGSFEKTEAEQIFNRYFDASPPDFNKDWILYCKDLISNES